MRKRERLWGVSDEQGTPQTFPFPVSNVCHRLEMLLLHDDFHDSATRPVKYTPAAKPKSLV